MTNMKSIEQYHQIKTKHIMKQLENIETIKNEDGALYTADKKTLVKVPQQLTECHVLEGTEKIGNSAFTFCTEMQSVTLPESLKEIGDLAFYDCEKLTSVYIPDSVETIGQLTFSGCKSLHQITLPRGLKEFNVNVFENITCELESRSPLFKTFGDALYSADMKTLLYCFSKEKVFQVKEGTEIISSGSFQTCKRIEEIVIPETVRTLACEAFMGCLSLRHVNIPRQISTIESNTFFLCKSLEDICIPDSVTTIGSCAFLGCRSLKKVVIPESVTHIDGNPFCECNCRIECRSAHYTIKNEALYTQDKKKLIFCFSQNEKYNVANGTEIIGHDAISGCGRLKILSLPASVVKLEHYAFDDCDTLERIFIHGKIKSAGYNGFFDNENLHKIVIPKGTRAYYAKMFCGERGMLKERLF